MILTIRGTAVGHIASVITLQKARTEAAATLTAMFWRATADTYFQTLTIATGDAVQLLDDKGKRVFLGSVQTLERTPETFTVTACDRGIYLTRNELSGVFAGTGAQIAAQVASRLGIAIASVDAKSGYQVITALAGDSAFSILRRAVGDDREITMDGTKLAIAKTVGTAATLKAENVLDIVCRSDIGSIVNRCLVVKSNGAVAGSAENAADRAKYGQFQQVQSLQGAISGASAQAKAALTSKTFTADITVLGDLALKSGGIVTANLPDWGLRGTFTITAVTHRWKAGLFTTELTLKL
ncbi:MAG: hypothetical protein LKJ86_03900 [Oscillibacter sp.]|jgi:uncharacterized metal-binding protein|nr:hypothetical protein [Oscillibacter sp.]